MSYPPPPPRRSGALIAVAAVAGAALLAALVAAVLLMSDPDDDGSGGDAVDDRPAGAGLPKPPGGQPTASAGPSDPAGSPSASPLPYVVLDPGECFDHPSLDSSVTSVEPRSCSGPHDGEVITNRTLTGDFTNEREFEEHILGLCEQDAGKKLESMPQDGLHYFFYALYPTLLTYEYQSQDEISCALTLSTEEDGTKLSRPLR